jgi:hypothetical protein
MSKLRIVSWVVLALVGALVVVGSLGSLSLAYSGGQDVLIPDGTTLSDLAEWNPEVAKALQGRRGTAAAFATAFATLFLFVVLVPYRRGEVWSWWALLAAVVVLACLTALRIPALGIQGGVGPAVTLLVAVVVGLLLDVGRLISKNA